MEYVRSGTEWVKVKFARFAMNKILGKVRKLEFFVVCVNLARGR
jgi:hypothetical protein